MILSFGETQYDAALGEPVTVKLFAENVPRLGELPLAVAFNANYLKFSSAAAGSPQVENLQSDSAEKQGLVRMRLNLKPGNQATGPVELADLVLDGYTPGISYLLFLNPSFKDQDGNDVHPQATASRIVVK